MNENRWLEETRKKHQKYLHRAQTTSTVVWACDMAHLQSRVSVSGMVAGIGVVAVGVDEVAGMVVE
jgi:hypothetical protein